MTRYFLLPLALVLTAGCAADTEEGDDTGASTGGAATGTGGIAASTGGALGTGGSSLASGGASSGGGFATGGAGAETGGASTGGSTPLDLIGDPPAPSQHPANDASWTRLPDDDVFTSYSFDGGGPFYILPIQPQNFPPAYDYCNATGQDAELNEQQQWARAQLQAEPKTWYYDVTLHAVSEFDGDAEYQLVLDGVVVAEYTAQSLPGPEHQADDVHVWEAVPIQAGQTVEIRSRAASNLLIEEGGDCRTYSPTYAWSRARFNGLDLAPAANPPQ